MALYLNTEALLFILLLLDLFLFYVVSTQFNMYCRLTLSKIYLIFALEVLKRFDVNIRFVNCN